MAELIEEGEHEEEINPDYNPRQTKSFKESHPFFEVEAILIPPNTS